MLFRKRTYFISLKITIKAYYQMIIIFLFRLEDNLLQFASIFNNIFYFSNWFVAFNKVTSFCSIEIILS